jgi:hypothetical protein
VPTAGLVIVQSPQADPANGDEKRMRRILAHEFAHQWLMDATASRKILGDGNRTLHLSPSLNEGIAELAGLAAIGVPEAAEHWVRFCGGGEAISSDDLSDALEDLGSTRRAMAFAVAHGLADSFGLPRLVRLTPAVEEAFSPEAACTADRVLRFCFAHGGGVQSDA